jgi:hypothetical protein
MTATLAQGSRLFSSRPVLAATDTLAFTATLDTEITRIFVTNNTAVADTYRIHHVDAGGAPSLDNGLYYDQTLAGKTTATVFADAPNSGIKLAPGDMIYVRAATGGAIAFNAYGVTANIAPQGSPS